MEEIKNKSEKKGISISAKSFITAIIIIFALMVVSYILTLIIPGGEFARKEDANGNLIIDTEAGFKNVKGGIPFWKWLLSPFLVLGASGNVALIAVIAFLLVIGGVFNAFDKIGLMKYMLSKITARFGKYKYALLCVVVFFFMALGSLVGSFEECVPLVPIVVALAVSLGWDVMTGIGMSLLAVGCGFSAGVCNPFTVGTAQTIAGLSVFSGVWLRLVSFVCIYALLTACLYFYAKKIEKPVAEQAQVVYENDKKKNSALVCFALIVGFGILTVICSAFIPFLQDITMIIVALTFLIGGVSSTLMAGMPLKELSGAFAQGMLGILPAVLMILMASSIKYTMEEAKILDTALHAVSSVAQGLPQWTIILFIYLIVLIMNFFIPSGSAKAFMLIPLIMPVAQMCGISMQLCILAFAFGDGFSNVFYSTNPALLISLGLADVSYVKWVKWSWKFQLLNLLLTCGLLMLGFFVGY